MTQEALQIKRHSIMPRWDKSQMEAGAVRIHARFQALITSVLESADWANYRLTKDPLEVGRPAWPSPGKFCDLVIARRSGHVEGALEIKTRSDAVGVSPIDKMHSTLDMMGTDLYELQRAAHQADALWVVALGIYRVPFQAMAISWDAEWSDIVLAWGRDVGRDSPMSMMRWGSFASLDNAMCSHKNLKSFFEVVSLPRKLPSITFNPPKEQPAVIQPLFKDNAHDVDSQCEKLPQEYLDLFKQMFRARSIHLMIDVIDDFKGQPFDRDRLFNTLCGNGVTAKALQSSAERLVRKGYVSQRQISRKVFSYRLNHTAIKEALKV